jgi:hypothetical protein
MKKQKIAISNSRILTKTVILNGSFMEKLPLVMAVFRILVYICRK